MLQKVSLWLLVFIIAWLFSPTSTAQVVEVDVFYPESARSAQTLALTGTVESRQHAELAPLRAGVVARLLVEAGDTVEAGQKLMVLDAKLAELNLAQIKAAAEAAQVVKTEAERLYQEVISLSERQLVAETLMSERQSAVAVASADVTRAKAELAQQREVVRRYTLYAPFAGVVAERNVDVGEWVTEQTRVFTLVEQQNLRLNVSIPQEYYGQLVGRKDIGVTLIPDFVNAMPIQARLDRLVAVANDISRALTGYIDLPAGTPLVAGMSARAEIAIPESEQAVLWVPRSAIKQHPDGGRSVFAVVNNKARRFLVDVVEQQRDRVAITGAPGDRALIISGVELLQDGTDLEVNEVTGALL